MRLRSGDGYVRTPILHIRIDRLGLAVGAAGAAAGGAGTGVGVGEGGARGAAAA